MKNVSKKGGSSTPVPDKYENWEEKFGYQEGKIRGIGEERGMGGTRKGRQVLKNPQKQGCFALTVLMDGWGDVQNRAVPSQKWRDSKRAKGGGQNFTTIDMKKLIKL